MGTEPLYLDLDLDSGERPPEVGPVYTETAVIQPSIVVGLHHGLSGMRYMINSEWLALRIMSLANWEELPPVTQGHVI